MKALEIVKYDKKWSKLFLNCEELEYILNQDDIRDRSVVIFSIVGEMRRGKSFMANFLLKFLYAKYKEGKNIEHWMGNHHDPLTGFQWRGGSLQNTTGIVIWPEIFLHDYPNGKKVAILVMDSQGSFDTKSTVDGCISIFALSTLMSSVQIYNINNAIQRDHLQYLSIFLDYARTAQPSDKPFQNLEILVRDWNCPYEAEYGRQDKIIYKSLERTENHELKEMFESCFEKVNCFLMPYPGKKAATCINFNGSYVDLDEDFLKSLNEFMPLLLSPDRLIVKKINGNEIQAKDFVRHMRNYLKIFENKLIPAMDKFTAVSSSSSLAQTRSDENDARAEAKSEYNQLMDKALETKKYLDYEQLKALHNLNNYKVQNMVQTRRKSLNDVHVVNDLKEDLEKNFNYYRIRNERNRPDTNTDTQSLIDAMTKQKEVIETLNTSNTKLMLELINKVTHAQKENKESIEKLIETFQNGSSSKNEIILAGIQSLPQILKYAAALK